MKRIIFVVLFLVSGLAIASAQVKLSFNPEKGKKYEYQMEMIQNSNQNIIGQEISVEMEMSTKYLMEIKEKTSHEITVQYTLQEIVFIVSNPMMKMGYDSKNPVENSSDSDQIFSKIFGEWIGQSFMAVFAPDGSLKSFTGMEATDESMIGAIATDNPMFAEIGALMKQQFNEAIMKIAFDQMFKIYPDNTVKVGNSWNTVNTIVMLMFNIKPDLKTKYTLKSVKRNMATIAVEGEIETTQGKTGIESQVTGTQTGTMTVDVKTGLPVTTDVSQNMKGAISVQGMEIQMETFAKTKTSIKEVK